MKPPTTVGDFHVLPLSFPDTPSFPQHTTHYLYLRSHEPKLPSPDSSRSLFLANVPVDSSSAHLRSLFGQDTLGNGRVEHVHFEGSRPSDKRTSLNRSGGKKRKRVTSESLLPSLLDQWDRGVHRSGATAVVVFVDKANLKASLRAVRKTAKREHQVPWPAQHTVLNTPLLGSSRYSSHHSLCFPPRTLLQVSVDSYMASFEDLERSRARTTAPIRQEPDEDGFITVTRGPKAVLPKLAGQGNEELRGQVSERRNKDTENGQGLSDFYRFQLREEKRGQANDLVKRFEEDKSRVEAMHGRRKRNLEPE